MSRSSRRGPRARSNHRTSPRTAVPEAGAPCPCGKGGPYGECCGRLHSGERAAATCEALMRSRYSAFVARDEAYLLRTWHPDTRPPGIGFDPGQEWTGLEILGTERGSAFHSDGVVVYRARFRQDGAPGAMTERSTFTRLDGAWVYVDGDVSLD
ncbi:YchJ family metal-binding protein [Streptomyces sp. HNM0574]|uniref:YchJ family protein n=1 Tax=Streptomyces sp. HNM0574 TaxID=2714954 RepID=UPI00146F6926|nr:YchJ family metal-binding protein [Streptomyces sp. HNM0574]NLU69344.1 hypothetical protein [Streptomyces sp. HNM0574]